MIIRLLTIISCVFATASVAGQIKFAPNLEITAGMSSFTPYEDFTETILTRNRGAFTQGYGNIGESTGMAFLRVGLSNQVSDRWDLSPYAEFHSGQGTLFEQDFYIFGISDLNPEERTYRFPAENSMRLFVTGIDARYKLIYGPTTALKVGTGLALSSRSHTYRDLLVVDFGTAYEVQSVRETFTTVNKTAVGVPLSLELVHQFTQDVSVGLHGRGQFYLNQEDMFWSAGLRVGVKL